MKSFKTNELRNFAIVGHASAGKTMLSEAILATSGAINRLGSIQNGTTVSDYHDIEKNRQISIHPSLMQTTWMDRKLNFIDTPGYLDFISKGLAALQVVESAVIVVDAVDGVQIGTDKAWEYASQRGIPKVFVVTGADRPDYDFQAVLDSIREHFGNTVFPMNVPVNPGEGFNQVLDVMRSEIVTYQGDGSGKFDEVKAEGAWKQRVEELHRELIEHVAESDDSLLERFFEKEGLTEEELRAGIHKAVQEQVVIPLFVTSGTNNIGVARLLDFIAKFGASPEDRPTVVGKGGNDEDVEVSLNDADPVLYVFETLTEPHVGELSFFRLYSGKVHTGMEMFNSHRNASQKIGQMFYKHGKEREAVGEITAGDVGVIVKMRETHTGDTLCTPQRVVTLPPVAYPKPNIQEALNLTSKGDDDKLAKGLTALHSEDPTFIHEVDSVTHETLISGQGELHLSVIAEGLRERFKVDFELVPPIIRFRETIRENSDAKYRHKKQTGGAGQFAEVWLRIEPRQRGEGVEFSQSLVGQNVDRVFVPSVEKGVMEACREGVIAGYPVVDVKINFYDGKMHPVDSKDIAFQIAGKAAFKEAIKSAKPCLLEPIAIIRVKVPSDYLGAVMGDLSGRRGRIITTETEGNFEVVVAHVPQRELYRYSSSLRALTGGSGVHEEQLDHYQEMPKDLEQKVIAESGKSSE